MGKYTDKIKEYRIDLAQLKNLEEKLFIEIRGDIDKEIPILNSKLPEGYIISENTNSENYDIIQENGGLTIELSFVIQSKGKIKVMMTENVNEFLKNEYQRLEEKYGLKVISSKIQT